MKNNTTQNEVNEQGEKGAKMALVFFLLVISFGVLGGIAKLVGLL